MPVDLMFTAIAIFTYYRFTLDVRMVHRTYTGLLTQCYIVPQLCVYGGKGCKRMHMKGSSVTTSIDAPPLNITDI